MRKLYKKEIILDGNMPNKKSEKKNLYCMRMDNFCFDYCGTEKILIFNKMRYCQKHEKDTCKTKPGVCSD